MAKETENLKLSLYDPTEDKDVKVKDVINNVLGYANSNTTKIDAKFKGVDDNIKILHDYILDSDGNIIFYSKAVVDKLLAGKLDLTGGVMTGELNFSGGQNGSILSGEEDAANVPGDPLNNLVIRSWWGVSFTTDCPNQTYTGKTAVGIDCRNGTIKAPRFEGVADNGVVASGSNYIRFGDGTQICWGLFKFTANSFSEITFPVAFSRQPSVSIIRFSSASNVDTRGTFVATAITTTSFTFIASDGSNSSWLAIGRWK